MITISEKKFCCGCSACAKKCPRHCITMKVDAEGFFYPDIDTKLCIQCGLCEKVCPVIHPLPKRIPHSCYAAYHNNEKIRIASSSGGIFTMIAQQIISLGGVVFGAKFDEDWQVVMGYAEDFQTLAQFRGSKYVQCETGDSFRQAEKFLKQNRLVLYTGTPCQIAGLKKFLSKPYDNLLTVDFICHGVPSPKVWKNYLKGFKNITAINFRNKSEGWKNFHIVIESENKSLSEPFWQNPYMQAFLGDMILRPSCYSCPTRKGKSGSDITIGDHWAIPTIQPEFDDDKGTSLVLLNSEKGKSFWNNQQVTFIETELEPSKQYNGGFLNTIKIHPHREKFFKKLDNTKDVSQLILKELKVPLYERAILKFKTLLKKNI